MNAGRAFGVGVAVSGVVSVDVTGTGVIPGVTNVAVTDGVAGTDVTVRVEVPGGGFGGRGVDVVTVPGVQLEANTLAIVTASQMMFRVAWVCVCICHLTV